MNITRLLIGRGPARSLSLHRRYPTSAVLRTSPPPQGARPLRSFTQPYQPSPKGLSGRPAHRPFRGVLSVHSRYRLHTRAVTLEEAGADYVPEFRLHDAVATDRVTVRDLLCHHSGPPRHDWIWVPGDLSPAQMLAAMRYLEPSDDIRSTFQYRAEPSSSTNLRASGWSSISARTGKWMNCSSISRMERS